MELQNDLSLFLYFCLKLSSHHCNNDTWCVKLVSSIQREKQKLGQKQSIGLNKPVIREAELDQVKSLSLFYLGCCPNLGHSFSHCIGLQPVHLYYNTFQSKWYFPELLKSTLFFSGNDRQSRIAVYFVLLKINFVENANWVTVLCVKEIICMTENGKSVLDFCFLRTNNFFTYL